MPFCSMNRDALLYDATPVENMFILEYMTEAPGDYVKVYLYLLMQCYHPIAEMTAAAMSRDLHLSEEITESALTYWQRRGLLRKTGDAPVCYTLINVKQRAIAKPADFETELTVHKDLADEIQRVFKDRLPTYEEENTIYDWVDVYHLSDEVVVMFLNDEKKRAGKYFSFRVADEKARHLASLGIRTVTDYEGYINTTLAQEKALRRLLARMGQKRMPSQDEKALYLKWVEQWKFTDEAIQAACQETTKGSPTMAYLDGILARQYQLGRVDAEAITAGMAQESASRGFAKGLYERLGRTGRTPSETDLAVIRDWLAQGFSEALILEAADSVHKKTGAGSLESMDELLAKWQQNGLMTPEAVQAERLRIHQINEQIRGIFAAAGIEKGVSAADRERWLFWTGELGMSQEMILKAAAYARESGGAMPVIGRILSDWHHNGISTVQAAEAEHLAHRMRGGAGVQPAARSQDQLARHEYTKEDYRNMIVDLDEEDF